MLQRIGFELSKTLLFFLILAEIVIFIPVTIRESVHQDRTPLSEATFSIHRFRALHLSGKERQIVDAEYAELDKQKAMAALSQVSAHVLLEGGRELRLIGKKGSYDLTHRGVEVVGGVQIQSDLGYQLESESIRYQSDTHKLETESGYVVKGPEITDPALHVSGKTISADVNEKKLHLSGGVEGIQKDQGGKSLTIKADEGDVDLKLDQAIFRNNVQVTQGEWLLTTQELAVDYDPQRKRVDMAQAVGNVVLTQGDRQAFCDRASILNRVGKIILEGNPRVVRGKDTIGGERIIFFTNEDKILIEKARGQVIEPTENTQRWR